MKTDRLCCLVHIALDCKHCGEVFCIPCGRRMGDANHFKMNMCLTRFTPEQLKDSDRCYEEGTEDCDCCELYKNQENRHGDRNIYDEDNYIRRLLVKNRPHGRLLKRKK